MFIIHNHKKNTNLFFQTNNKKFLKNKKNKKIIKRKLKQYNPKFLFRFVSKKKKQKKLKYFKIRNITTIRLNQLEKTFQRHDTQITKIYIKITLNNIFITYFHKNKIYTKSIATLGFKGKSKQTVYAYKTFAESILKDLKKLKTSNQPLIINFYIKSLSKKLKPLYHILKSNHIKINKIYDMTSQSFNGCRKRKITIKKKRKSIIKFLSYI